MAVGGYASASLITHLGASIWVGFLVAVFATAIFGLILGVAAARVSGPYLAGTTLVIALALPSMANRFESVLGGNVGLIVDFGTPPTWISNLIEVGYEQWQLWVALPIALIALFFVSNLPFPSDSLGRISLVSGLYLLNHLLTVSLLKPVSRR